MDAHIAAVRYHVVIGTSRAGVYSPGAGNALPTLKYSESSSLPIIVVCENNRQAQDVDIINTLTEGKLTKIANGLPRIRALLNCLEEFDTSLLSRNSETCEEEGEVEEELPQASSSSSTTTAPAPVIDLVTPPSFSASTTVVSKLKTDRMLATPTPSASTQSTKGKTKRALTPTNDTQARPSSQALPKAALLSKTRRTKGPLHSYIPAPSISVSSASTSFSSVSSLAISSTNRCSAGSEMANALSADIFMRHHSTDGTVTGTLRYNDQALHSIVFPHSKHLPLSVIDYIRSHGYSSEMMVLIETAMAAAGNDKDGFVKAMVLRNYPGAEAGFIWRLAHKRHAL
ncbi:hypothetical protein H1R20_g7814, partial [Candolleomyces eurysporus]